MSIKIKKGDYIEGIEEVGAEEFKKRRLMRIVVDSITTDENGNTSYYGRADDTYYGARGGYVSTEYGEVKVITDEEPFTRKWWKDSIIETGKAFERVFCPGELVQHFKGMRYMIIDIAEHVDTGKKLVIYKALYGDYKVWARDYDEFVSKVDRKKYPKATQKYRFEKVYK